MKKTKHIFYHTNQFDIGKDLRFSLFAVILLTAVLLLLVTACGIDPAPTLEATTVLPEENQLPQSGESGYPPLVSESEDTSSPDTDSIQSEEPVGYPAPEPTATQGSDMGGVTGVLQIDGQPIIGGRLYLFQGESPFAAETGELDGVLPGVDPVITDEAGSFQFINVLPGTYSLILETVFGNFVLFNSDGPEFFEVASGQQVDLEPINLTDLPREEPPYP